VNCPVSPLKIGRLAREEERVFNRLGQRSHDVQPANGDVAVCAARVGVGLPVVRIPGDEQVCQPVAPLSEQASE